MIEPATIVKGIVAYTYSEERAHRRKDFSRVVFTYGSVSGMVRADTILVPRIPSDLKVPALRRWLTEYLPTKLRPLGRITYEDFDDEVWVKMGH